MQMLPLLNSVGTQIYRALSNKRCVNTLNLSQLVEVDPERVRRYESKGSKRKRNNHEEVFVHPRRINFNWDWVI